MAIVACGDDARDGDATDTIVPIDGVADATDTLDATTETSVTTADTVVADGDIVTEPFVTTTFDFPPPGGTTAESIVVRGRSLAGDPITSVTVNDVPATSADGFATWTAAVPLALGPNVIAATVQSGRPFVATTTVTRWAALDESAKRGVGPWPGRALGLAWEPSGQRVILTDDYGDGVVEVDVATGDRTILSDSESGDGPGEGFAIVQPTAVAANGEDAWVVDDPYLVHIDLVSGDRTLFPGGEHHATGLARDPRGARVLTLSGGLVSIDPVTGDRQAVGAAIENAVALGVDAHGGKAYVLRVYQDEVVEVDLTTGAQANILADAQPRLSDPRLVAYHSGAVFIWDDGHLVKVDVATGARSVLPGSGPELLSVHALDSAPGWVLAIDYVPEWEGDARAPMLVAIDPTNGTRVVVAR